MQDKSFYEWYIQDIKNGNLLEKFTLEEVLEKAFYAGVDHKRESEIRGDISPELDDPDFEKKNPEFFVKSGKEIEMEMKQKIANNLTKVESNHV